MPFEKGKSGNPAGRPPGATGKIPDKVRDAFALLLENKIPELESWLSRIALEDPAKAMDLWIKISERFVPALARTEITGKDGEDLFANVKFNFITADSDSDEDDSDTE